MSLWLFVHDHPPFLSQPFTSSQFRSLLSIPRLFDHSHRRLSGRKKFIFHWKLCSALIRRLAVRFVHAYDKHRLEITRGTHRRRCRVILYVLAAIVAPGDAHEERLCTPIAVPCPLVYRPRCKGSAVRAVCNWFCVCTDAIAIRRRRQWTDLWVTALVATATVTAVFNEHRLKHTTRRLGHWRY